MTRDNGLTYEQTGVATDAAISALGRLVAHIAPARHRREDGSGIGDSVLESGFFASILNLGNGTGLALATDGVGTKVLVAEMAQRYDTVGIDCIAMNVNDLICVGAEPLAMLDYLAVQATDPEVFDQLGRGLAVGAERANISIPGGEVSQMKEIIRGVREGEGIDLVGAAVGLVDLDKLVLGEGIDDGDVVVGLLSNGLHSNGYTLARRVFFGELGLQVDDHVDEFGHTVADELLRPTAIYVKPAMAMLRAGLPIKAFSHMTSDGFLNLLRVRSKVGYVLHDLPETQPVFDMLQKGGRIADEEMFLVYNMGIGFGVVVPEDTADEVIRIAAENGSPGAMVLGRANTTDPGRVVIEPRGLVGEDDDFHRL